MISRHPGASELIDLHFGELEGAAREGVAGHVSRCPRCRAAAEELAWLDRSLADAPEELPPPDGLARLLAQVEGTPRAGAPGPGWTAAVASSLAGVAGAAGLIWALGIWLLGAPMLTGMPLTERLGAAPGFGLAALVFFGIGSFATLAIAPVLLMESRTGRPALGRR
jgi:anti-sigma factor RsiW